MSNLTNVIPVPVVTVVCSEAYANNQLHGVRLPAVDKTVLTDGIQSLLASGPMKQAIKWHILQYEYFHDLVLSAHESLEQIVLVANFLLQHGLLGAALLAHTNNQVDKARHLLQNCYQGSYVHKADFASAYCDAAYGDLLDNCPKFLLSHVDYTGMANVLLATNFFSVWVDDKQHIFEHEDSARGSGGESL